MLKKIKLILDKLNENHRLDIIILILIMIILNKDISSDISFYIAVGLGLVYQQGKELNEEIKQLKKEIATLKKSDNESVES